MGGKTKRIIYKIACVAIALAAIAGTALLIVFALRDGGPLSAKDVDVWISVGCAIAVFLFFPLNLVFHELGHLFFGLCVGMYPVAVQMGYLQFSGGKVRLAFNTGADGATSLLARNTENLRKKMIISAIGGACFNLFYAAVFLTLWFLLPSAATLFFVLLCPMNIFEALYALIPSQRAVGANDGGLIAGLVKKQPFAEVALGVVKVQSELKNKSYKEIPREWLYDLPVVREDDGAFVALLQLRWQYLFCQGDITGAKEVLKRLDVLYDYAPDASLACDLSYAYAVLLSDRLRAEEYLSKAKGAKGTLPYICASAACGDVELPVAFEAAERERGKGARDFGFRLINEIPNII